MYLAVGKAVTDAISTLFVICVISVPLAIWKVVEIIIWIYSHVEIGIK